MALPHSVISPAVPGLSNPTRAADFSPMARAYAGQVSLWRAFLALRRVFSGMASAACSSGMGPAGA